MSELFDRTPIEPIYENYIGYSTRDIKRDLSERSSNELKKDLQMIEKQMKQLQNEWEATSSSEVTKSRRAPVYGIKEQLANLELSKKQVLDELSSREKDDNKDTTQSNKKYKRNLSDYKEEE